MSARFFDNGMPSHVHHASRLICGVCADIADRAGLPAWMPRTAFVIFGLMHWLLAVILYVVLARTFCARRPQAYTRSAQTPYCGPSAGNVRDRFGGLEARLSNLEAATMQRETALRRAFRDLEGGRI